MLNEIKATFLASPVDLPGSYYTSILNSVPILLYRNRVSRRDLLVVLNKDVILHKYASSYGIYFDGYSSKFPGGLRLEEDVYYKLGIDFNASKLQQGLMINTPLTQYIRILENKKKELLAEYERII